MNKNKLIEQCRYYKGEKECPFNATEKDYWDGRILIDTPRAFWWWVEKEVVEMGWDDVKMGVKCKIYKYMEYALLDEERCVISYINNAIYNTENNTL